MRNSISAAFIVGLVLFFANAGRAQSGWFRQSPETTSDLVAVYFTSASRGFIGGDNGYLASTDDGGRTWHKIALNTKEDINEIYFRNDKNGYLVAGRLMFITEDGGRTWGETRIYRTSDFRSGTPVFSSIRFSDKKHGIAIGSLVNKDDEIIDSLVMRTEDGGDTWQRVIIPTKNELFHLDFNGNSHGWIVGDKGLVLASTDAGKTWSTQNSGVPRALFAVNFRDDNNGFAVGGGGTIIRTTDGGNTWIKVENAFPDTLKRVSFADDKNGWAVGHNGTILLTSDKGRTWVKQSSGVKGDFYGLFISKKSGCAVGEKGNVVTYKR
ncbi:MAG: hypothetical protein IT172_03645 [Acidobacteria bacterium]|nr:hypothetical protein [Acidobacteriota bacterium]